MTTLTIRLPDDVSSRIKTAAAARGVSVNRWMADLSLQALTEQDAEASFRAMAAKADIPAALAILDRLDREAESNRRAAQAKKPRRTGASTTRSRAKPSPTRKRRGNG